MVLPLPMRMGSLDAFIESTRARIRHGDAKLVLIDDLLADFYIAAAGDPPIAPMRSVMPGAPNVPTGDALELPHARPGTARDPAVHQRLDERAEGRDDPRSCAQRQHRRLLRGGACWPTGDVMVSWLPLYHDMGLVGFLALPMTKGVDLVQAAPQDFLAHPGNWMQWLSDYGGHRHRGTELLVGAGHPGAQADAATSTCRS